MSTEKQKQIEQRAYALWQAEGRPHGKHEEHWHQATREVEAEEGAIGQAGKASPRQSSRRAKPAPRRAAAQGRKRAKA